MDNEKQENKAKPMKKRNVQLVHEHFEEAFRSTPHLKIFWRVNAIILLRSIRAKTRVI